MKGICQSCGKVGEVVSCDVCGARVCTNCKLEVGCKICKGKLMF